MSKKILSLFLVLCMLLLSVPVFVLSVIAEDPAEDAITISFNGTAPAFRVNTATISGTSASWPSDWSMGAMKTATTYSMFGMYTTDGGGIVCGWSDGAHGDMWANGGVYLTNFSNRQFSMITTGTSPDSLHLTSSYTGKLTLDVKQLMNGTADNGLAIFHNGTMIWPNEETAGETAYFSDTTKWFVMSEADTYNYGTLNKDSVAPSAMKFEDIDVEIGDAIDIAAKKLADADGHTLHDLIVDATFSDITAYGYTTSFNGTNHFPSMPTDAKLGTAYNIFPDNDGWDLVSYALDHTDMKQCNIVSNAADTDGFWGNQSNLWEAGMTGFRFVGNGTWGKAGAVSNAADRMGGPRWTADRSGVADITIDNISTIIYDPTWASSGAQVALFINGTKLWPSGDGWFVLHPGDSYSSATLEGMEALHNVAISAGDTVEMLAKNLNGAGLSDGRGTNTYFTISFSNVSSIFYRSAFSPTSNAPWITGDHTVTYSGGWDTISYASKAAVTAGPATTMTSVGHRNNYFLAPSAYCSIGETDGPYNTVSKTAVYINNGASSWNEAKLGIYAVYGAVAGYRYTVPYDGNIAITLDKIGRSGGWNDDVELAVFISDTKIWPTGEDWYSFTHSCGAPAESSYLTNDQLAEINAAIAVNAPYAVKVGDTVEFLVHGKINNNWSDTGNVMYASVNYTTPCIASPIPSTSYAKIDYLNYLTNNARLSAAFVKIGDAFPAFSGLTDAGKYVTADGVDTTLPAKVTGATTVYVCDRGAADNFTAPALKDGTFVYSGNWAAVGGVWSDNCLDGSATTARWNYRGTMTARENDSIAKIPGGDLWGNTKTADGGIYTDGKFAMGAGLNANGAMWTAPETGVIAFDFTNLTARREVNAPATQTGPISYYFAVVLNGEIVWPSDGKPYHYVSPTSYDNGENYVGIDIASALNAYEAFPQIKVGANDQLAFVGNRGNSVSWMFYIMPSVHYVSLDTAAANANVTVAMTEAFSAKIDNASAAGYTDVKVAAFRTEGKAAETITGGFKIAGFTSTELTNPITYTITGKDAKGNLTVLKVGRITIADYLKALIAGGDTKTADLAYAILNYANEAEKTFKGSSKIVLPAYEMQQTFDADPTSVFAQTADDGEQYRFSGASLLLNDNVSIKLFIDRQSGAALSFDSFLDALSVDVFANADVKLKVECDGVTTYVDLVNRSGCTDGTFLKAFVEIPVANYGKTYTFAITDATGEEIYSTVLTYSVESYLAAMTGGTQAELRKALWIFAQAAAAYTA